MQFMTQELEGYRFKCQADDKVNKKATLLLFEKPDMRDIRLVAWRDGDRAANALIDLHNSLDVSNVVTLLGNSISHKTDDDNLSVSIGPSPVFIEARAKEDSLGTYCGSSPY